MIDELRQALNHTSDVVGAVSPDQYGAPTPCSEFDVRALINHLVAGNLMFATVANGDQIDMAVFEQDNLGDDPAAAYRQSAESAIAAWQRPGALDENLGFANLPGSTVIKLHLAEELTHGWDLARATDQDTSIDPALAEPALEAMQQMPPEMVRNPQMFGHAVEVDANAPAGDRLVAFLGRNPA